MPPLIHKFDGRKRTKSGEIIPGMKESFCDFLKRLKPLILEKRIPQKDWCFFMSSHLIEQVQILYCSNTKQDFLGVCMKLTQFLDDKQHWRETYVFVVKWIQEMEESESKIFSNKTSGERQISLLKFQCLLLIQNNQFPDFKDFLITQNICEDFRPVGQGFPKYCKDHDGLRITEMCRKCLTKFCYVCLFKHKLWDKNCGSENATERLKSVDSGTKSYNKEDIPDDGCESDVENTSQSEDDDNGTDDSDLNSSLERDLSVESTEDDENVTDDLYADSDSNSSVNKKDEIIDISIVQKQWLNLIKIYGIQDKIGILDSEWEYYYQNEPHTLKDEEDLLYIIEEYGINVTSETTTILFPLDADEDSILFIYSNDTLVCYNPYKESYEQVAWIQYANGIAKYIQKIIKIVYGKAITGCEIVIMENNHHQQPNDIGKSGLFVLKYGLNVINDIIVLKYGLNEITETKSKFDTKVVCIACGHELPESPEQNYEMLKKELLKNGNLFEDNVFPASNDSLFHSGIKRKSVKWLRPHEIVLNPFFISDGISRFDVRQGELGDCWLLAALTNLTLNEKLFEKVVDQSQSFSDDYCGIFYFRFWRYGEWVDVVIDDRLPTVEGKLIYLHSEDRQEFWSALLEKAYAKLYGSYEALEGGWMSEALIDMTGGLTEVIKIKEYDPKTLLKKMLCGTEMGSIFGCSIDFEQTEMQPQLPAGLYDLHAYSITGIKILNFKKGKIPLIRIRNPWGTGDEWTGKWSDKSKQWKRISQDVKDIIEYRRKHDGEFWMEFDDFRKNFKTLDICHLNPKAMEKFYTLLRESREIWSEQIFHSEWICGKTAGGCQKDLQSFAKNPQYYIRLYDEDGHVEQYTLNITILQKYRREFKSETLSIKFAIYRTKNVGTKKLDAKDFANKKPFFESKSAYEGSLREITCRRVIPPGEYIIVPFTTYPNEEGNFMLRIFADGIFESHELH